MSQASMLQVAALATLEQALNTALALDPLTGERLARLSGKVVAVELQGIGLRLCFRPREDGSLEVMGAYDGEVDTTLRGAPLSMLRMGTGAPGEGLFDGAVQIDGDVELGQRFQRVFEHLDIDWEEHLARLSGDVIAHQLGNIARGLSAWGRRAATHLGLDAADYLQEEALILPTRNEVAGFLDGVDELREGVDRLAARLDNLQRRLGKGDSG